MKWQSHRVYLFVGSILALSAVVLGAFGAHALKARLVAESSTAVWETAVRYQMWHALALLLIALLSEKRPVPKSIGACMIIGTILFSGSLYALALGGPGWLGPITPLGGLCLIAGWALLAFSFCKNDACNR